MTTRENFLARLRCTWVFKSTFATRSFLSTQNTDRDALVSLTFLGLACEVRAAYQLRNCRKFLGLQIWISTVFRAMRQFLTSTCDILRISRTKRYFYPRKHHTLMLRMIYDLKKYRRFILQMPGASFSYVLGRLPWNRHCLSSDAFATYGMAGVLHFSPETSRDKKCSGLFWQLRWDEWNLISSLMSLSKERVHINAAEFLAALITIETFAEYCKEKITILGIDNTSAKSWLDSARCPKAPYDRCAQSTHLFMIKQRMKIRTQWVSSVDNILT